MEIKKIQGVIIGEKDYGESSKIVDIITPEYGIIGVLAKGCKRLKSTLKSVTDLFTYAEFELSYKENKLSILIDADIIKPLTNIKKDIEKISYLNFICELTKQVIKQTENKDVYDIFINTILKIEDGFDPLVITNILELKYLDFLGVSPKLDGCVICGDKNVITLSASEGGFVCKNHIKNDYIVSPKTIKIIRMLKYVDISKISKIDISNEVKKELDKFIDDYYDRYTGLYLNSKNFLKNIVKLT